MSNTVNPAGSPAPTGSAKTCQWLLEGSNWSDCGRPATHKHVHSSTYYCALHADALRTMVGGVHRLVAAHAEKYVIETDGRMRVEWPSPNVPDQR